MADGIDLPPVAERLDRFEEAAHVVTSLLRQDVTTYEGRHYRLVDARCEPKPLQHRLPLLIAGAGERRTIPMAARYADAWHAWAEPDEFRRKCGVLTAACEKIGRDPSEVRRVAGQVLLVVPEGSVVEEDSDIIGPADHVAARLLRYRDAGVDEFVVRDHVETPTSEAVDSLEALASDVIPVVA